MPLTKVHAKLLNVHRVVEYGKKDKLQLVDRETREILADVKRWDWKELNPTVQGAPTFKFTVAQEPSTVELLPICLLAFNGVLHDVPVRNKPEGLLDLVWEFRTRPTNELVG